MYRFFAVLFVFAAAACGGSGAGDETPTPAATSTPTENVAGAKIDPPSPTATAQPGGPYAVVAGDTLGAIAERFGTTVEALVAANQLANANEISVGQMLIIPAPGATPAATTTQ